MEHFKAPIMSANPGVRYTQCCKCGKVMALGSFHQAGDHLYCLGCPTNLLLTEMTMVEWDEYQQAHPCNQPSPAIVNVPVVHDGSDAWMGCTCEPCMSWRKSNVLNRYPADLFKEINSTITEEFKKPFAQITPISFVRGSFQIDTGEVIEPLHKRQGFIYDGKLTSERCSKEADAAQYYFLELGISKWVLMNFADGDFSPMHKGLRIDGLMYMPKPATIVRHGCPYTLERNTGGKTIIMDELIKSQLDVVGALWGVPVQKLTGAGSGAPIPEYEQYLADIQKQQAGLAGNLLEIQTAVARCAYKLGIYAGKGLLLRNPAARKELKDQLADELKAIGLTWADVERVVRNMDGAIKNV